MIQVEKIVSSGASPRRRTIYLSGTTDPVVCPKSVLQAAGIEDGYSSPSVDELRRTLDAVEPQCAMDRALDAVSRRELSVAQVRQKLLDDGYTLRVTSATLKRLQELGYVDDARFAEHTWRSLLASSKGAIRVRHVLRQAGVSDEVIERSLLDLAANGEPVDELSAAIDLAHRWCPPQSDAKQREKVLRRLVSRGYTFDIARTAVRHATEQDGYADEGGTDLDGDLGEGLA